MGTEHVGKVVTWSNRGTEHTGEIKAFVPARSDARAAAKDAGCETHERSDFNKVTLFDRYVVVCTRYSKGGRPLGRVWFAPYASQIDRALSP